VVIGADGSTPCKSIPSSTRRSAAIGGRELCPDGSCEIRVNSVIKSITTFLWSSGTVAASDCKALMIAELSAADNCLAILGGGFKSVSTGSISMLFITDGGCAAWIDGDGGDGLRGTLGVEGCSEGTPFSTAFVCDVLDVVACNAGLIPASFFCNCASRCWTLALSIVHVSFNLHSGAAVQQCTCLLLLFYHAIPNPENAPGNGRVSQPVMKLH